MRVVLLGDLHFYQLGVWPWQLFSKRLVGQTNLWVNRRRHFDLRLWPAVRDRIIELAPAVLLGSGDFTTTALRREFEQAYGKLQPVLDLPGLETLLVPGNHDRYCFGSKRHRLFERAFGRWTSDTWPCRRVFGGLTIIALDPTRPNKWNASGKVGQQQLEGLATLLAEVPEPQTVIVLCHYPIGAPPELKPEPYAHGLEDKQALADVLTHSNRRILYLHGHVHWPWVWQYGDDSNVTTINAGAPMLASKLYPFGQGFVSLDWENDTTDLPDAIVRHVRDASGEWQSIDQPLPSRSSLQS